MTPMLRNWWITSILDVSLIRVILGGEFIRRRRECWIVFNGNGVVLTYRRLQVNVRANILWTSVVLGTLHTCETWSTAKLDEYVVPASLCDIWSVIFSSDFLPLRCAYSEVPMFPQLWHSLRAFSLLLRFTIKCFLGMYCRCDRRVEEFLQRSFFSTYFPSPLVALFKSLLLRLCVAWNHPRWT